MEKLWEIADAIERVMAEHTNPETGEISESASQALDELEMARNEKALAVARYLLGERAEGEAVKAQAQRLARRAQIHANRAAKLERYLAAFLPPGTKLSDDVVQIKWSWPERVDVDEGLNLSKWPERFVKTTREPRKNELKAATKAGEEVPKGVHLRKLPKLRVG